MRGGFAGVRVLVSDDGDPNIGYDAAGRLDVARKQESVKSAHTELSAVEAAPGSARREQYCDGLGDMLGYVFATRRLSNDT